MIRTFVEISSFTRKVERRGRIALLLSIQSALLDKPSAGAVIPGTGGLRKLRVGDSSRRKGKRGGWRVIYLDLPEAGRTFLLALYGKGEKDDMSNEEKRVMSDLVAMLKREVKANAKN